MGPLVKLRDTAPSSRKQRSVVPRLQLWNVQSISPLRLMVMCTAVNGHQMPKKKNASKAALCVANALARMESGRQTCNAIAMAKKNANLVTMDSTLWDTLPRAQQTCASARMEKLRQTAQSMVRTSARRATTVTNSTETRVLTINAPAPMELEQ